MIKVLITYKNDKVSSLEVKGHANSAKLGKDLVCSAVSAVIIGGLNNIQDVKTMDINISDGHVLVRILKPISYHDEIVIETIIASLETIRIEEPNFIDIKKI